MNNQTTINFDAIRAGIDRDFPVSAKATPKPTTADDLASIEAIAKAKMPAYYRTNRYSQEVMHWIATDPDPVKDTETVTAVRVSRSMVTGGLSYSSGFTMAEIGDPQNYVDNSGLCLETRNADGEVIAKYFPQRDSVSFI